MQRVTTAKSFAINQEKYLQPDQDHTPNSEYGNAQGFPLRQHRDRSNSWKSHGKDPWAAMNNSSLDNSLAIHPFSGPGSKK